MRKKAGLPLLLMTVLPLMLAFAAPGWAIIPLPDFTDVCQGITCETLQTSVCSGEFKITLTKFESGTALNGGTATYTYEICRDQTACPNGGVFLSNPFHLDITFPKPGGNSCLGPETQVYGECVCNTENTEVCDVDPEVEIGSSSCLSTEPDYLVAKCVNILLAPSTPPPCVIMSLHIASETIDRGLGVGVWAGANACTENCLAGPSCTRCEEEVVGPECLVRTKGFWGTHPHIATQYDPVTICGVVVGGQQAGTCSTSEALCTSANDYKENPPYLSFIAQLTAAKLNLNATRALFKASCSTWEYQGKSIKEWVEHCETSYYCSASKQEIGRSGCIEALTAFNESQDTGFDVTPAPFDQPGPADSTQCQDARGNRINIGNCLEQQLPNYFYQGNPSRDRVQ